MSDVHLTGSDVAFAAVEAFVALGRRDARASTPYGSFFSLMSCVLDRGLYLGTGVAAPNAGTVGGTFDADVMHCRV